MYGIEEEKSSVVYSEVDETFILYHSAGYTQIPMNRIVFDSFIIFLEKLYGASTDDVLQYCIVTDFKTYNFYINEVEDEIEYTDKIMQKVNIMIQYEQALTLFTIHTDYLDDLIFDLMSNIL